MVNFNYKGKSENKTTKKELGNTKMKIFIIPCNFLRIKLWMEYIELV